MKRYFILLLACLSLCSVSAQHIKGLVSDSKQNPIPYANILVYNLQDTTFVVGVATQENGKFDVAVPQSCDYLLRISCLNYQKCQVVANPAKELSVTLQEDVTDLQEVVVKSSMPKMKMSDSGITMQIAGTALEKIGTAEDLLGYIPSVVKRGNDYEVFGKGTPVFYINNKKVRNLSELDRLSSERVKNIEVIHQPGAQYDAASPAVIKITTKDRYNGGGIDLRSSYYQSDRPSVIEQADWSYLYKTLETFGSIKYEHKNTHNKSISATNILSDTLWNQSLNQNIRFKESNWDINAGLNYAFSKKHQIGLEYHIAVHPSQKSDGTLYSSVLANGQAYDEIKNSITMEEHSVPEHQVDMFYSGQIGKLSLNFDATFLYNKKTTYSNYEEISQEMESRDVHTAQVVRNRLTAAKLSIQYPLWGGVLSCGTEYIHTQREDDYENREEYIPSSWSESKMSNSSVFAEYSYNLSFGAVKAGVRYESESTDYDNNEGSDLQKYHYRNWFPNISLRSKIKNVSMQIGYTTRTARPTYKQLSSNVIYGNRFLWQTGNPYLRPEYIHNIFLSGWWKFVNFSLNYENSRNAILYWVVPVPQQTAVSCITYINLPSLSSFSASVVLSPQIGVWSPQLAVLVKKQWLSIDLGDGATDLNKPVWQLSLNNLFKLNRNWILSANGWLMSKGNIKNMEYCKNVGAIEVGVTKSFFKDLLSLQLRATDILHTIKNTSTLNAKNISMPQDAWTDSRQIVITVRCKLNKKQSKFKGSGAGQSAIKRL